MAITYVIGESEYYIAGGAIRPARIILQTNDSLSTVMTTGYLNSETTLTYANDLMALVQTTDGLVELAVNVSGGNTSLVWPQVKPAVLTNLITSPGSSLSSSLAIGTAYQNTTASNILLSVYLNVTSALSASILLGVGSTNNPTQQTIVSGLTLAVLGVIPVNILIPKGYYAKLSTSGTIAVSIAGQIAMPV